MQAKQASVLLVEDDADLRIVLSAQLAASGYRVRTALDGLSALLEIASGIPDLIVSVLNMPRMSGFELLSVVRRQFPTIPLIAMSSAFSDDAIPHGVSADAFYQKGTDPGFLLHLMDAMIRPQAVLGDIGR
jgi:CheY-like chemotaxis protein